MSEWAQPSSADVIRLLAESFQGNKEADARARALIAAHITSTLLLAEAMADLSAVVGSLVSELQHRRQQGAFANSRPSCSASVSGT